MIRDREGSNLGVGGVPDPDALPFLTLMFEAYQSAVEGNEVYRAAESLSRSQVRVMTGLSESPGLSLEELARTKDLGIREAEDAVESLKKRNYVRRLADGKFDLSAAGSDELDLINTRWQKFGESQLAGIPRDEVKVARRFLARLLAGSEPSRPSAS